MSTPEIVAQASRRLMTTYLRPSRVVFDHGEGVFLFDLEGKKYLDFAGGVGTCVLGHGDAALAKVVADQTQKLITPSNLYHSTPQVELAEKLGKASGMARVFFSNSGTEANEAAFKLARYATGRKKIISVSNAFHGRTFGSLSATPTPKYQEPFAPLVPGFVTVADGDLKALEAAMDSDTAAVILEAIQGEGGVRVHSKEYLQSVRKITKEKGALMILDEVQCGNGRTGKYFAYQHAGIQPDVATTAKGLANGLPLGATLAKEGLDFQPGLHGSTFGGNAVVCQAALEVVSRIIGDGLMKNAEKTGTYFMEKLGKLKARHPGKINEIRGKGLMIGVELNQDAAPVVSSALEKGLLVNKTSQNVLRFLPPLIATESQVNQAVGILDSVFSS